MVRAEEAIELSTAIPLRRLFRRFDRMEEDRDDAWVCPNDRQLALRAKYVRFRISYNEYGPFSRLILINDGRYTSYKR